MMRKLIDVIDEMLSVIPKNEISLIAFLEDVKESQRVRAPEDMIGWYQVSELLETFEFNKKTPMWKLEMCSIFSTQPIEEILSIIKKM